VFKTLKAAQAWIESVEKFGQKYDLTRMQNACAMLGNPQNSFKSIHIGGTNGKGSTLSYMKESLIAAGYNVGTFISPYIVHFNERITVNHAMISDEDLLYYINQIYAFQTQYLAKYQDQITFFELLTLISFQYFKDQPVDLVLYEVGLGGTLDATNVITPIMSIIVSIGYDHMGVLGNTLTSIAKNKLGIVKPKVPLIHSIKQPHLKPLINSHANMMASPIINARMHRLSNITHTPNIAFNLQGVTYSIRMRGAHQIDNARLAITALTHLNHLGYHVHTKHIQTGLTRAFMPGRFEAFKPQL